MPKATLRMGWSLGKTVDPSVYTVPSLCLRYTIGPEKGSSMAGGLCGKLLASGTGRRPHSQTHLGWYLDLMPK
eukprot:5256663-Heterocapsa_arctica.AAC.1